MAIKAEAIQDIPEGFKLTEIGPLPQDWQLPRFDEVVRETVSGDWGQDKPGDSCDLVNCYVVRGTDFQRLEQRDLSSIPRRWVKPASITKRQLQAGDLLVELSGGSKDQPTGRVLCVDDAMLAWADRPVTFTNFVKLLRVDQARVDPWFLYRFWTYVYERGATRVYEKRTTGIRNFKYREFLEHENFPLPPLDEQRAIAEALFTIQQAIEATDRVIATARQFKSSLMRHLFTYGPVPIAEAERVPLKETETGPVPEHWQVLRLGEMVRMASGGTPSRANPEYFGGPIPWVKSGELNDSMITSTSETVTKDGLANSSAKIFPSGTLLVAMYGATAGMVGILALEAATNQAVCAIFPDAAALPGYLFHALVYRRSELLGERHGGAQPNISQTLLRAFRLARPPVAEQEKMADILSTADHKIQAEQKHKAGLRELFRTMLHLLMTGQVRVRD